MRIISKKKDYFDCIQAYDEDRSLVYIREEHVSHLDNYDLPCAWANYSYKINTVGFCGKIYPVVVLHCLGENYKKPSDQVEFCYNIEQIENHVNRLFKTKYINFYNLKRKHDNQRWRWNVEFRRACFERWFEDFKIAQNNHGDKFKNGPIFIGDPGPKTITYNPLLSSIHFYRLFDVNQAYQELRMYLSNIAAPEPKIPQLSNEDLAASKGHGDKYSFRKAPSKAK